LGDCPFRQAFRLCLTAGWESVPMPIPIPTPIQEILKSKV